ncbi:hypothetical protein UA08_04867 [Talaromyces atroroseus]|uniref:MINDY deubiquitinase domain-containing protein n=1 Tax=Talaromyces atroroseus TaxID=1441469 RepID=A0A225B216_TALAT|nr:hypothetical protein UA08_04867 [Talaromyces atroroseus]OKL59887.1 hypothetical protein UA08_04867 [Talaromyces atroroseus]
MVLRKNPPPGISVPSRTRNGSDPRSPVSRSSASPRSATQQSSRKDSWELDTDSIYSPDLHTSPAFDLMPLEEAQKSPVAVQSPWEDELVERPTGMTHVAATTQPGAAADQMFGNPDGINYQHTGLSVPSVDDPQKQLNFGDSVSGTSPQRFRSNNPFLRSRNPSPNPWDDASQQGQVSLHPGHGASISSLHPDASERNSQTSGIIPMTARLSIFDEPEEPWGSSSHQSIAQTQTSLSSESALRVSSENGGSSLPGDSGMSNQYPINQAAQYSGSNNHWQGTMLTGASNSINGSNASASQPIPRAPSPQLIDLGDTPTNTQVDPWSSENQAPTPHNDQNKDRPKTLNAPASTSAPLPPMSEAELRRFQEKQAETYAIRHVNWIDHTGSLRESPVLVQSQNGPCPLLALVNGLIMRSDRNTQPPIVRALQIREHISLGLLIQALFDELVTYSNDELPDIEALSRFLTMLHTGMNVNPRLTLESSAAVGSFSETKDLLLYDSFKVPLIHGWIAAPTSEAHDSMARVAEYYEDMQLLHFRKEELEDRVIRNGSTLSPVEERLMGDIQKIIHFVSVENATQLTAFGLTHLGRTLSPGSVSILFRNDHFSTLYKHPQSGQLFTLITDAGYADHPEVVWESLVDVTGSNAEFYAGDFRPVGHGPSGSGPAVSSHLVAERTSSRNNATTTSSTTSSQKNTEQEDADYAYALSLQFQEEARQQQQQQRQQRGRSSSSRLPSSSSAGNNTALRYSQSTASGSLNRHHTPSASLPSIQIPNRSNENHVSNNDFSNIPQDAPVDGNANDDIADDAPPPSYEQVARNKAAESLNRQQQQSRQQQQQQRRQQLSYTSSSASLPHTEYGRRSQYPGAAVAATGRRQPLQTLPDREPRSPRDKDCIVM